MLLTTEPHLQLRFEYVQLKWIWATDFNIDQIKCLLSLGGGLDFPAPRLQTYLRNACDKSSSSSAHASLCLMSYVRAILVSQGWGGQIYNLTLAVSNHYKLMRFGVLFLTAQSSLLWLNKYMSILINFLLMCQLYAFTYYWCWASSELCFIL